MPRWSTNTEGRVRGLLRGREAPLTVREVAHTLGVGQTTARKALQALHEEGSVRRHEPRGIKHTPGRNYYEYVGVTNVDPA